jgi:F0F1-type ATP synthase assembly protein I
LSELFEDVAKQAIIIPTIAMIIGIIIHFFKSVFFFSIYSALISGLSVNLDLISFAIFIRGKQATKSATKIIKVNPMHNIGK